MTLATTSTLGISTPVYALTKATNSAKPWVVRALSYAHGDLGGACTGAALNEQMVITAAHCKADVIKYEDIDHFIVVDAHYPIAGTDIQVLVLRDSHPISQYPVLGPDRLATANSAIATGTLGAVYGYGPGDELPQKQLSVRIDRHGATPTRKEYLQAISANGGDVENGDSGAPLIIDNQLVGVLSGARIHPKDGHSYAVFSGISPVLSTIRQLEHAREMRSVAAEDNSALPWISAVTIENGRLSVTMSSELVNSGQQVVIWRNGQYIGEVQNDISYYCDKTNISGGSIISPTTPVYDSDVVQIGITRGVNRPQAAELLYESIPTGIEAVNIDNGKLTVTLTSQLLNSGHKIAMWVNGKYTGEVQNNHVYYASRQDIDGASILTFPHNPTHYGDLIQIGIVTDINSPEASILLYSGRPSGIESVDFNNNHFDIKMTPAMFNTAQRLIIWVDGAYSAEFYNGQLYYGAHMPILDGNLYQLPSARASATSTIEIGIVPGVPGSSFGTPETAKILYRN